MATRTTTSVLCDNPFGLHRPTAEVGATVTRPFTWDGRDYVTDLCGRCATGMDGSLAEVLKHARPVKAARPKPAKEPMRSQGRRELQAAVRAWAKQTGLMSGDRGRIPVSVWQAYEEADRD